MDYTTVAEMQQNPNPNPNPNSDFSVLQNINYSASYPHNLNSDPYQPPGIDPHNALFPPLPRQPVVDLPHVLPPVAVNYARPPAGVHPPPLVQPPAGVQPQQVAGGAAASFYPDPNVSWAVAISQFGSTTYAVGVTTPNPSVQSQGRNTWIKGPKKTKVVQSAWCEVCKIDCNSKNVLDQHLSGKKHKKNLEKLNGNTANTTTVPGPSIVDASPAAIAAQPAIPDASHSTAAVPPAITDASPSIAAAQPAIPATSPASIAASTPLAVPALAPTGKPFIGPEENPDKPKAQKARKKAASCEDLETKRRKMLEEGASADAVRACSICNVVCNSETVFNYHLAGQKHASMLKKQTSMAGVASAV